MALYVDGVEYGGFEGALSNGGGGGGGFDFGGSSSYAPVALSNLREFDLSPIQGLSGSQRFGGNLVSDIQSAYQTYITGSPSGRGGQYALDAQRQFGYSSVSQAAAVYLQAAGLKLRDTVAPTLEIFKPSPVVATPAPTPTPTPTPLPDPKEEDFFGLPVGPIDVKDAVEAIKKPVEILADVFQKAFGNAVYNPPLQSQATSYTPGPSGAPSFTGGGGGSMGIGGFLILGVLAIAAYFVYKRVKGA